MERTAARSLVAAAFAVPTLITAAGAAHADSGAAGTDSGSPGVLSGNSVQAPVHVPVNLCGDTVSVVGALNPAAGNACGPKKEHHPSPPPAKPSEPGHETPTPPAHTPPPSAPPSHPPARGHVPPPQHTPSEPPRHETPATPPAHHRHLAETGADGALLKTALPVGAAALIGGAVLMRRVRRSSR